MAESVNGKYKLNSKKTTEIAQLAGKREKYILHIPTQERES